MMSPSLRHLRRSTPAVLLFLPVAVWAATPPEQDVTIPASGGDTVTITWTGTAPAGANATSACTVPQGDATEDQHVINVTVPEGVYDSVVVTATFNITWEDDLQDLILTVEQDNMDADSSDGGSPSETVTLMNPTAEQFRAIACAFAASVPTDYSGSLTLTAEALGAVTVPPSDDAMGLAFSASVPADIQRDEGEPIIEIDADGNVYTCGPTGASQAEDYAQVSRDGGDQFHLLGEPPRGQTSLGGGGDCGLATAPERNADGFFQLAYTGLSGLANFTTATSPDAGATFLASPTSQSIPGVDRQWNVFSGAQTVFLNYNQVAPRAVTIQRSDDGGLTYGPSQTISPNPGFPGPLKSLPADLNPAGNGQPAVYYPWDQGTNILLAVSLDNGDTWNNCVVSTSVGSPSAQFMVADHDNAGNIYIGYTDDADFNTYMVSGPASALTDCLSGTTAPFEPIAGFSQQADRVQMNRDDVVTSVFPWLVAGGEPGRVAMTFYGSPTPGRPDSLTAPHTWHVYVSQSLNAMDADPAVAQVRATTRPMHYGQVCLLGLGCTTGGDRTLVDFFALDYNPANGELLVVYNTSYKRPDEAVGLLSSPIVTRQIAGPSNGGGFVQRNGREVLRTGATDPTGDAFADFSSLGTAPMPVNIPAADVTAVEILPALNFETGGMLEGGGFTVQISVDDLSDAALNAALTDVPAQSLLWIFWYWDGYRHSAAQANWNPGTGFGFGHNGYVGGASECGSPMLEPGDDPSGNAVPDQCLYYPGTTPLTGEVDQDAGVIRITVPLDLIRDLDGGEGMGEQPAEVAAAPGDRIEAAAVFSQANPSSPTQDVQSFLVPLDNTPAMDFLIPGAVAPDDDDPVPGEPPSADPPSANPASGSGGALGSLIWLFIGPVLLRRMRRSI